MAPNRLDDLDSVDGRIAFLEAKIFAYKDGGWMDSEANPQLATRRALEQKEYQDELVELRFLRRLYDEVTEARIVLRWWHLLFVLVVAISSLFVSAAAFTSTAAR